MDRENLLFHIKSNDYFGTLATILDLMNQSVEQNGFKKDDAKLIAHLRDDLVYLNANYVIRRKPQTAPSLRQPSRKRRNGK
jgi:hypothetical protein